MKYLVVYSSSTGNTKMLADAIYKTLPDEKQIIDVDEQICYEDFDFVFLGYWIDKGECDNKAKSTLSKLHNTKVAIFGTMGAADIDSYGKSLEEKIIKNLPQDNKLMGKFICQGKIPQALKERYIQQLKLNPDNIHIKIQIESHEKSQTHPDDNDIKNVVEFTKNIVKSLDI